MFVSECSFKKKSANLLGPDGKFDMVKYQKRHGILCIHCPIISVLRQLRDWSLITERGCRGGGGC